MNVQRRNKNTQRCSSSSCLITAVRLDCELAQTYPANVDGVQVWKYDRDMTWRSAEWDNWNFKFPFFCSLSLFLSDSRPEHRVRFYCSISIHGEHQQAFFNFLWLSGFSWEDSALQQQNLAKDTIKRAHTWELRYWDEEKWVKINFLLPTFDVIKIRPRCNVIKFWFTELRALAKIFSSSPHFFPHLISFEFIIFPFHASDEHRAEAASAQVWKILLKKGWESVMSWQ